MASILRSGVPLPPSAPARVFPACETFVKNTTEYPSISSRRTSTAHIDHPRSFWKCNIQSAYSTGNAPHGGSPEPTRLHGHTTCSEDREGEGGGEKMERLGYTARIQDSDRRKHLFSCCFGASKTGVCHCRLIEQHLHSQLLDELLSWDFLGWDKFGWWQGALAD